MPIIYKTREPRAWNLIRNNIKSISGPVNASVVGNVGITRISKKFRAIDSLSTTSLLLKDIYN
jgi:hypothetical protein